MSIALSLPDPQAINHWWLKLQFTSKRRMGFYRDMENALRAGIAEFHAIERMCEVSRPRRSLRWLVSILEPTVVAMKNGKSFASAMSDWVPQEDAALLYAGEESKDLPGALSSLIELLESKLKISSSLKSNLIPSLIFIVMICGVLVYIIKALVPVVKGLVPDEVVQELSILPHYLAFGRFVLEWGLAVAVGVLALGIVIALSLPRWTSGGLRSHLDARVPPWTLYTRIQAVFFLVSISSMMRAGRTFKFSVESMNGFASPWLQAHFATMLARLRSGKPEVSAMQVGLLPVDVADRLNFYAILPNFMAVMQQTARDAMEQLIIVVARIGGLVKTLVLLIATVFIMTTLLSIYEMSDGMKKAGQMQQNSTIMN